MASEDEELHSLNKIHWEEGTACDKLYSNGVAEEYEKCFAEGCTVGWYGPTKIAEMFEELNVEKSVKILDLGCGSGFVGVALRKRGYMDITGIDASQDMIDIAEQKNCYTNIYRMIINDKNSIPSSHYNKYNVVCSGGFIGGPTHGLEDTYEAHLVCAKIGGYCMSTTDQLYMPESFKAKRECLASNGQWELLH